MVPFHTGKMLVVLTLLHASCRHMLYPGACSTIVIVPYQYILVPLVGQSRSCAISCIIMLGLLLFAWWSAHILLLILCCIYIIRTSVVANSAIIVVSLARLATLCHWNCWLCRVVRFGGGCCLCAGCVILSLQVVDLLTLLSSKEASAVIVVAWEEDGLDSRFGLDGCRGRRAVLDFLVWWRDVVLTSVA